jgi:putative transcriptional regulator
MELAAGQIIISTQLLDDTNFEKVVILITAHNNDGTLGYIINQPFHRKFNELEAFKYAFPLPLFTGGPVATDMLFCVHRCGNIIKDSVLVSDDIYIEGDFQQLVQLVNNNTIEPNDVRLFLGYCGWDAGELEAEIEEGSWQLSSAPAAIAFETNYSMLWQHLAVV